MKKLLSLSLLTLMMLLPLFAGCEDGGDFAYDGYTAVAGCGLEFVAVGTGGRIEVIHADGSAASAESPTDCDLNSVVCVDKTVVAVGEKGTVVAGGLPDGLSVLDSGVGAELLSVTRFNGKYIAVGRKGTLLTSADGGSWSRSDSHTKDDIISVAATQRICVGITSGGKLLLSSDGNDWRIFDYNGYYSKQAELICAAAGDGTMYVAGMENGVPTLIHSVLGDVWTERPMSHIEGKKADLGGLRINSLAWDGEQLVAACADGRLLYIPDCQECNRFDPLDNSVSLISVACNSGRVIAVGGGSFIASVYTEKAISYAVDAEEAIAMQIDGAVIIDVRSADEYSAGHMADSVNIPLAELETELPVRYPDKAVRLVFYCSKGVRSASAAEAAVRLGYTAVFDLGGLEGSELVEA